MLFGHFSHTHTLAFKTQLTKACYGIDAFKIFSSFGVINFFVYEKSRKLFLLPFLSYVWAESRGECRACTLATNRSPLQSLSLRQTSLPPTERCPIRVVYHFKSYLSKLCKNEIWRIISIAKIKSKYGRLRMKIQCKQLDIIHSNGFSHTKTFQVYQIIRIVLIFFIRSILIVAISFFLIHS